MRRKDREVLERKDQLDIIRRCHVCRVAFADEEGLSVVPMNFGYTYQKDKLTLYFHSGKEGRKVRAFLKSPAVAFEMDIEHGLVRGQQPCQYSFAYESVMGQGRMIPVLEENEKRRGLDLLMEQETGKRPKEYPHLDQVFVFRLEVQSFSVKSSVKK